MVTKGLAAALNARPRAGTPWLQALGSHGKAGLGEVPRITPLEAGKKARERGLRGGHLQEAKPGVIRRRGG